MNLAVAKLYALCIGTRPANFHERLEDVAGGMADEISRLEKLLDDPFIKGYLEAKRQGSFHSASGSQS